MESSGGASESHSSVAPKVKGRSTKEPGQAKQKPKKKAHVKEVEEGKQTSILSL